MGLVVYAGRYVLLWIRIASELLWVGMRLMVGGGGWWCSRHLSAHNALDQEEFSFGTLFQHC